MTLKRWLRFEWERTQLPLYKTNQACGVANAATRKYFTKDHLWYAPPPELFAKLVSYANQHGEESGKPYFSVDGKEPLTQKTYEHFFAKFKGKYGITKCLGAPSASQWRKSQIARIVKIRPSKSEAATTGENAAGSIV